MFLECHLDNGSFDTSLSLVQGSPTLCVCVCVCVFVCGLETLKLGGLVSSGAVPIQEKSLWLEMEKLFLCYNILNIINS